MLLSDLEVRAFITTQAEARRLGAMALFGEKYGDQVRVVEVGDYARELCGGTHVARSGQLGLVKILTEASIGSGVRRVEALVGLDAFSFLAKEHLLVSRLAELYRVPNEQVGDRVEPTIAPLRDAEKELEKLRAQLVLGGARRSPTAPATSAGSRTSASRRPRARPATTCAPWPRRSAATSRVAPGSGRGGGRGRRQGVAGRRGQRRRPGSGPVRGRPGQGRAVRPRRRQRRAGAGWRSAGVEAPGLLTSVETLVTAGAAA